MKKKKGKRVWGKQIVFLYFFLQANTKPPSILGMDYFLIENTLNTRCLTQHHTHQECLKIICYYAFE